MTIEDPNNPGNKVIMPKEVFDELYRSLSLKKNREPKTETVCFCLLEDPSGKQCLFTEQGYPL